MATRTIANGGGNWNNPVTTWVEGFVPTSSDDVVATGTSGQLTVNITTAACATLILTGYTGTLTIAGSNKLTVNSTLTLVAGMTLSGDGIISIGSTTATITSGGLTIPFTLAFTGGTKTLGDNWDAGSVTHTGSPTVNGNTLNIGGSFTSGSGVWAGTTAIILDGTGSWSTTSGGANFPAGVTINTAGTITMGTVGWGFGTLTYIAGTVNGDRNLTLNGVNATPTFNIDGMTLGIVGPSTQNIYPILTSDFACDTLHNGTGMSFSFTGNYDITVANLIYGTYTSARTLRFDAGNNLNVTNSLILHCGYFYGSKVNMTIDTNSASTAVNLNYTGTAANCKIFGVTFTDIDASGSTQGIDNWYGGTLTRTTNITNRTSADIGGSSSNVFGIIG